jgi:hypothetical protein
MLLMHRQRLLTIGNYVLVCALNELRLDSKSQVAPVKSDAYFTLDAGAPLQLAPILGAADITSSSRSTLPLQSVSMSMGSTISSSMSNNATKATKTGLSTAEKVAIGVSVPVGVILTTLICLGVLWRRAKTENSSRQANELSSAAPLPKELAARALPSELAS